MEQIRGTATVRSDDGAVWTIKIPLTGAQAAINIRDSPKVHLRSI
jgi:hypothetical protein